MAGLRHLLEAAEAKPVAAPRIWLGAPNAIKEPTSATFPRQSGSHLLIVGQNEEAQRTLMALALIALAAQHPHGAARFVDVRAVAELAISYKVAQLREIRIDLFGLSIPQRQGLPSRRISNIATALQREQLPRDRRMFALVDRGAHLTDSQPKARLEHIQQTRFARTARPHQRDQLARLDREAHVPEGNDLRLAPPEDLRQVLRRDRRHQGTPSEREGRVDAQRPANPENARQHADEGG